MNQPNKDDIEHWREALETYPPDHPERLKYEKLIEELKEKDEG